jgi:hypothetical protein
MIKLRSVETVAGNRIAHLERTTGTAGDASQMRIGGGRTIERQIASERPLDRARRDGPTRAQPTPVRATVNGDGRCEAIAGTARMGCAVASHVL